MKRFLFIILAPIFGVIGAFLAVHFGEQSHAIAQFGTLGAILLGVVGFCVVSVVSLWVINLVLIAVTATQVTRGFGRNF